MAEIIISIINHSFTKPSKIHEIQVLGKVLERYRNKVLGIIANVPWYTSSKIVVNDLCVPINKNIVVRIRTV